MGKKFFGVIAFAAIAVAAGWKKDVGAIDIIQM